MTIILLTALSMMIAHQISMCQAVQDGNTNRDHNDIRSLVTPPQRKLLSGGLLFFVRAPDRDDLIPVEVHPDATVQTVFDEFLADYAANYDLTLDGENALARDQDLADSGICAQTVVQLQSFSDCFMLEAVFRDTDVKEKRGWTAVTTPDSCCSFDEIRCDEDVQPPRITGVYLGSPEVSKLTGPVHMEYFQQMRGLRVIALMGNELSGELDLTHLPDSVLILSLNDNRFEGTPTLTNLPSSLVSLNLNGNRFSGCPAVSLPASLRQFNVEGNDFDFPQEVKEEILGKVQYAYF